MSTTTPVQLPDGRKVVFTPRHIMQRVRPMRSQFDGSAITLPQLATGPIDWTNNGAITYPMDGNNQLGDCMYAAACHIDNTFTGMNGQQSSFDLATLEQHYRRLSGGDHGLDEQQITDEWHAGLCGDANATILDSLDIDTTNPAFCRSAIYFFGSIFFMLSVPNAWINNSSTGSTWDAPARPNPRNGHGVCWVGKDAQGRYKLITWGTYVWLTEAGVPDCDPGGFVVFSRRWFDPKTGLAPNGLSYDQLAALWTQCGGKPLPANPFPSPLPPTHP